MSTRKEENWEVKKAKKKNASNAEIWDDEDRKCRFVFMDEVAMNVELNKE